MVLERGIVEGRRTYANMIKYIKMTASSNFGNIFSVLIASAFLPFLPMAAVHLLLLNLIYDVSCAAIPWDNVDEEYLERPRTWDVSSIGRFMVWMGPTSSVFDIVTYLVMFFVICPAVCGGAWSTLTDPAAQTLFVATFQAGWFVESMWTQTLVVHMIRTPKIPFLQSHASAPLCVLGACGIALATLIPFTPIGAALDLAPLPVSYFGYLLAIVCGYMLLATAVKTIYVRRFGELL
jgi:Mg2+-importing ATPase